MKKVVLFLIVAIITSLTDANTLANEAASFSNKGNSSEAEPIFKLFSTQNQWIFLKLNTRNGKIWLFQWSLDPESRFETVLNSRSFASTEKEKNGRFTLYSTVNFYNFILVDQVDGRTWQVQWSLDPNEWLIVPIE